MIRFFQFTDGFDEDKECVREMLPILIDNITESYGDDLSATVLVGSKEEILSSYGSDQKIIGKSFIEGSIGSISFDISEIRQAASTCLSDCIVMLSGFQPNERAQITAMVEILGGEISSVYCDSVNVIIASSHTNVNLHKAEVKGVDVVSKSWIEECYETLSCASIGPHVSPPFTEFVITSSGLLPEDTRDIRDIVIEGGGLWSDHFDDAVNAVIAPYLSEAPKIQSALRCGVPVIRPAWIYECKNRICSHYNHVLNFWAVDDRHSSLFTSLSFTVCEDVTNASALKEAILHSGGTLSNDGTYKVVNFDYVDDGEFNMLTANWVWDCISDSYVYNRDRVLHRPLGFSVPIPEFKGAIFSVIGFKEPERRFLSEAIRILGGTVIHKISKLSGYILSADNTSKDPFEENSVRYINSNFISQVLSSGVVPSMKVKANHSQDRTSVLLQGVLEKRRKKKMTKFFASENIEGINDFSQRDTYGVIVDVEEKTESDYSQLRW